MKKFVLSLRKAHRNFTIPFIILLILKLLLGNSTYGSMITKLTAIGMLFMALSGLIMYIYTIKMKKQKIKKNATNSD